jgi:hypothetical protein
MKPPRRPVALTDTRTAAWATCTNAGRRAAVGLHCGLLLCAGSQAAAAPGWGGQLYGGEYYSDQRLGAYGIASQDLSNSITVMTELMFERYHNGDGNYDFYGAGVHLLWQAAESTRFGLTGSHLHDSYDYDDDFADPKSDYTTNALGLEAEFNREPFTLAAQAGLADSDYYHDKRGYYSMDAYYWGDQYQWYARGAVRYSNGYKEVALEAYRAVGNDERPLTLYAGASRTHLRNKGEFQTVRTQDDSVYAGGFIEFLSTPQSRWSLSAEAARGDSDMFYTLELNISFGPGADAPWLSAVDFTL